MITVCGEGLVDLIPTYSNSLAPYEPALGGGPYNVALAASRLEAEVSFVSRLSTDAFGQAMVDQLRSEGVNTQFVQRGPEPTTLAVTSIGADGSAAYSFYMDGTADRFANPAEFGDAITGDIAYFGTCSLALEPGASAYAELLHSLASRGTLIALDPNIRPFYETSKHRAFIKGLLDEVTLLKLSQDEFEFLGGARAPITVITRGSQGLMLLKGNTQIDVPAVKTEVADTIGAGDTIMAALLAEINRRARMKGMSANECAQILNRTEWEQILKFAATAAAITVSRRGAQTPTRFEVTAFQQ